MGRPSSRDRVSPSRDHHSRRISCRRELLLHHSYSSHDDPLLDSTWHHRPRRSSPSHGYQYASASANYRHDYSSKHRYDSPRDQILLDHLKLEEALLIADSYSHSRDPYADTMEALTEIYGQPHQLAFQCISKLVEEPNIKTGDTKAFRQFGLKVRTLVGMLEQLGNSGRTELWCGSHVSSLLGKLPHDLRASFRRCVNPIKTPIPTLLDLAEWLEYEARVQVDVSQFNADHSKERQCSKEQRKDRQSKPRSSAVSRKHPSWNQNQVVQIGPAKSPRNSVPFATPQHYPNQCANFQILTTEQIGKWIRSNQRCWKCGRNTCQPNAL
ncbi:uncharacterized protein LOC144517966 [Sander vitreus]